MIGLEIVALVGLGFWLLLALSSTRSWPGKSHRLQRPAKDCRAAGSVVAIVPARNEAALLRQTLPSLLANGADLARVILVDDDSSDGTATIARDSAAEIGSSSRLLVTAAPPTPAGWAGKVHALACGVERALDECIQRNEAPPDWWLFTDADILHPPGSVTALLQKAVGRESEQVYDLVSIMARLRTQTFWERLLVPAFVFFFQLIYPFRRVSNPGSRVAAAAGGCVLVCRRTLERAGGLAVIRGELIDDVALAKRLKQVGGNLWLGLDAELKSLRPYAGLDDIWQMVARSAYVQLRFRADLMILVVLGLLGLVAAAPVMAGLAAWKIVTQGWLWSSASRTLVWSLLGWVLQAGMILPAIRHHRVPAVYAAGLPVAAVLYALMTINSAWEHWRGHGTRWKGRAYTAYHE